MGKQEESNGLNIHYQMSYYQKDQIQSCQIDYTKNASQSTTQEESEQILSVKPAKRKLKTKGFLWKPEEDALLMNAVQQIIALHLNTESITWKLIALSVPGKTSIQCNQRWRKISNYSVKSKISQEEAELIIKFVEIYGKDWKQLSELLGQRWTGKQIRDKYLNQLDPNISRKKWTKEEDEIIKIKVEELGTKWKKVCQFLPGRAENAVKNRYNNTLKHYRLTVNKNQKLVKFNNTGKNKDSFSQDIEDQELYSEIISEGLEQFKEANMQTQSEQADDSSEENTSTLNTVKILQSSLNAEQKVEQLKALLKLN